MAKQLNQRRIVVCDPRFQYRYLVLPVVVTLTTSVCLLVLFLYMAGGFGDLLIESPELAGEMAERISNVRLQCTVAVGAILTLHVVIVVLLGLLISHRIAGPVYRVRKSMEEVARGNVNIRVKLRDGDKFTGLADAFNKMMDSLAAQPGDKSGEAPQATPEMVLPEAPDAPADEPPDDASDDDRPIPEL